MARDGAPLLATRRLMLNVRRTIQFFRPWPELLLAFTVFAGAEWDCFARQSPWRWSDAMCWSYVWAPLGTPGRAGLIWSPSAVASPHDLDAEHSNNLHFPDAKLVSDRFKLYLRKVKEAVSVQLHGSSSSFKLRCWVRSISFPNWNLNMLSLKNTFTYECPSKTTKEKTKR